MYAGLVDGAILQYTIHPNLRDGRNANGRRTTTRELAAAAAAAAELTKMCSTIVRRCICMKCGLTLILSRTGTVCPAPAEYVTAIVLWWHRKQQSYDPLPSPPPRISNPQRGQRRREGGRSFGNENVRRPPRGASNTALIW